MGVDLPDGDLVTRIAAGDAEAFGVSYRRHFAAVVRMAVRRCRDTHEVSELCAVVFIAVFEKASTFDRSRGAACVRRGLSLPVELESTPITGLDVTSYAQCELIRSVDSKRLLRRMGSAPLECSTEVSSVIRTPLSY